MIIFLVHGIRLYRKLTIIQYPEEVAFGLGWLLTCKTIKQLFIKTDISRYGCCSLHVEISPHFTIPKCLDGFTVPR